MSSGAHKVVVVIQDATGDFSSTAFRSPLIRALKLQEDDELLLIFVLHSKGVKKFMVCKSKADLSSGVGAHREAIDDEVAKKKAEYQDNPELVLISNLCETEKVKFRLNVCSGKMAAILDAKKAGATWVILDRQIKKEKNYFMEGLSCRISVLKRDNTIEKLRGSKRGLITYNEMFPGPDEDKEEERPNRKSPSDQKTNLRSEQSGDSGGEPPRVNNNINNPTSVVFFSKYSSSEPFTTTTSTSSFGATTEASSSGLTDSSPHHQDEEITTNTERETAEELSPPFVKESEKQKHRNSSDDRIGESGPGDVFKNSICSFCKNRRPKIGWTKDFTYSELQAATERFDAKNFLSEGGFGSVYRGVLKNGMKIAVKQHTNASFQGEKEFKSEVAVLSKARHKNVVVLIGSCAEGKNRLLVYEYVCNGSLDQHLSKHSQRPLSWEKRMKVAVGAAEGLRYLHENNIIHRDVKPSNILVTHDHESLLGDFGLARTQHEDSEYSSDTRIVGALGYLAPEYAESGKVSTKTDVYAFGVVLLQLITGRTTTDKCLGGKSLVGWARPLLKERNYPDLIDERLKEHDVHQLFWMVRVAEKCLSKDPHKRDSMEEVVVHLNNMLEGNTLCSMGDFSPSHSDSASSSLDSNGSEGGNRTTENAQANSETTDIQDKALILLTPKQTETNAGKRISTPTHSGQPNQKSIEKKVKVPYEEMVI